MTQALYDQIGAAAYMATRRVDPITDPKNIAGPWSAMMPLNRDEGPQGFE